MNDGQYFPGLEGVIAGETAIATIEGGLAYRGYPIEQLAESATFPEVAYLLLHGELPNQEQLADFQALLVDGAAVEPAILQLIQQIPLHVSGMDVLRTGVSGLAHFDPQCNEHSPEANLAKSERLLGQIPRLIAARYRASRGAPLVEPRPELGYAANLLWLLTGEEPTALAERAMDVSLILYAEHEFNASTFTARVVASTQSDLHSAITAAIGALKGALHGGANERVMQVLEEVGSPAAAADWIRGALARKMRIMGFGHRVYRCGDPRAVVLKDYCRRLAAQRGDTQLDEIADTIEQIVWEQKQIPPNLDWPSARLYHYLGLDVDVYTPLFVASRAAGWAAHYLEQSQNNRLIRPRSRYQGPRGLTFRSLSERG